MRKCCFLVPYTNPSSTSIKKSTQTTKISQNHEDELGLGFLRFERYGGREINPKFEFRVRKCKENPKR